MKKGFLKSCITRLLLSATLVFAIVAPFSAPVSAKAQEQAQCYQLFNNVYITLTTVFGVSHEAAFAAALELYDDCQANNQTPQPS
ncbi:hypothetical protein ACFQZE_05320 [Paenibacillus sp. GCM10027627]|uniref:hypothetical protein n=1 Tax=unclassified Paenibacillus TaxID=185978 RepID=UPI00362DAE85